MFEEIIVIGSGGLGDFIVTWPYLRGRSVTVATKKEWGRLARLHMPSITYEDVEPWMPFVRGIMPPPKYSTMFKKVTLVIHSEIVEKYQSGADKYGKLELVSKPFE